METYWKQNKMIRVASKYMKNDKRKNKRISLLLIFIILFWFIDIVNIINPQDYLQKYSSQGVESISYYRVKVALLMGGDVNKQYDQMTSPVYSAYLANRKEIFNLLLSDADCHNINKVIRSDSKNGLLKAAIREYDMRCSNHK